MINKSERINIKDLVIEEPQLPQRFVFRPEEEVGEDLWNFTMEILNHYADIKADIDYSTMAYQLGVMFPERKTEIVSRKDSQAVFTAFISRAQLQNIKDLPFAMEAYYSFLNTKKDWSFPTVGSDALDRMYSTSTGILNRLAFYPDDMNHLANYKIVGGVSVDELHFTDEVFRAMVAASKKIQPDRLNIPADIRILYPDKPISEIVSDSDIDLLHDAFRSHWVDRQAVKQGVDAAFRLYILTAEKLEVNISGLEINLPEKVQKEDFENPPLPETRRY